MDDSGAKCDLIRCRGLPQEDSEEKYISMLLRDHSCDNLMKEVAACCLCPRLK